MPLLRTGCHADAAGLPRCVHEFGRSIHLLDVPVDGRYGRDDDCISAAWVWHGDTQTYEATAWSNGRLDGRHPNVRLGSAATCGTVCTWLRSGTPTSGGLRLRLPRQRW